MVERAPIGIRTNAAFEQSCDLCRQLERELNAEKQHITELEGRLRVLWDKLEGERKYHLEHLRLQEEHLSEIERENERLKEQNKRQNEMIDSLREMYAKEAKP
jgi:TolA-binding protein